MQAIDADPQVVRCAPVFVVGDAHAVATDRLIVGFKSDADVPRLLEDHGCTVLDHYDNEFVVGIDPSIDPFDIVTRLDSLPQVDYAEPDFATFGEHIGRRAGGPEAAEPLAPGQYAVDITKAQQAWRLQAGDRAIKVAILDEGVDTRHADLAGAVVGAYDAIDNDCDQQPNAWDAHGTACAGLAVAVPRDRGGAQGIAGGCSLLTARIAYSPVAGGWWTTRSSWIARAVDWAWMSGADVLSNSWGSSPSSAIINAFRRARTKGRGGKGCVIAVAAGNANRLHDFPANLDDVLTVAASNEFDEPKTPDSRDGETWWGSSFGPKIDLAAPGVHNRTTDIPGEGGYNSAAKPDGDYVTDFNGTSSATPIVAGAAALVLSANPDLSESEVRAILRATADKVGPLPYIDGRNDRMGHGRLNVLGAVQSALVSRNRFLAVEEPAPDGKHRPVTNAEPDSEREVNVVVLFPARTGGAASAEPKVEAGLEVTPLRPTQVAGEDPPSAPNTESLRDIAEASFGRPDLRPETVYGRDDRARITATADYPWRANAALLITARDGSRWVGTGWFVGPHTLVTAGHAVFITNSGVPGRDGWVRRITVMPGRNGDRLPHGWATAEIFHSVAGWTEDGDPDYDYGAITIPSDLGDKVGTLGVGVLGKAELVGTVCNISGYPADKPDGTQWHDSNRVGSVTVRRTYYQSDTVGGQSGAAVYRIEADGTRTVFAIHGHGDAAVNSGLRITTPVYRNLRRWMRD